MTYEDLKNSSFSIPGLFAYGINADCHPVDSQESGFTYKAGIPSSYSSLTGKKVCRADINGIGMAVSKSKWFNQLGGYYTFNQQVSDMIGGYPLGAVLNYKDEETGEIREVRSLVSDNNYNFVSNPEYINDEYWSYVDNVPARTFRPRIFPASGNQKEGDLSVNQQLLIPYHSMLTIQTGVDSMDCTDDGEDYYLYITVKHKDNDEFFTAGTIAYLPSMPTILAEGIMSIPNNAFAAQALQKAFHSYTAPSPIQLFLSAGDTIMLKGNREFSEIEKEKYHYQITPLTA